MRILAAPGALVLLFARVILYVITLRGLVGVANRDNSGGGAKEREHYLEYGYAGEEVTEAVGGAPVEPGEWEGNNSSGGPKKLSPLADRGVLLLLVLLHNRVRKGVRPFVGVYAYNWLGGRGGYLPTPTRVNLRPKLIIFRNELSKIAVCLYILLFQTFIICCEEVYLGKGGGTPVC